MYSLQALLTNSKEYLCNTNALSLANFVGIVVGFLNVFKLYASVASSLPPRYPLKANGIYCISGLACATFNIP
jgi:hypothetical protein